MAGELKGQELDVVNAAVKQAELDTGVEFCVLFSSSTSADLRREAERFFHRIGSAQRPAVLIMVVPHARKLEVVTAHELRDRITDTDCDEAVRVMTGLFARDQVSAGLQQGIELLAQRAGVIDNTPHRDGDLPNVVNLDDE